VRCLSSRCMAMIIYCWHAIKLECVHSRVVQPCVDQIRRYMFTRAVQLRITESLHCTLHRPTHSRMAAQKYLFQYMPTDTIFAFQWVHDHWVIPAPQFCKLGKFISCHVNSTENHIEYLVSMFRKDLSVTFTSIFMNKNNNTCFGEWEGTVAGR
jgi:hypothetical protein